MQLKAILTFLLFFGVLFTITPTTTAQITGWTVEIPGAANAPDYLKIANNGETVAVFWHNTGLTTMGFATRTAGVWAIQQQTLTISLCASTNTPILALLATAVNEWTVVCNSGSAGDFSTYYTTNNGASWTLGFSFTGGASGNLVFDHAQPAGAAANTVFYTAATDTTHVNIYKSTNGMHTVGTLLKSYTVTAIVSAAIVAYDSTNIEVWYNSLSGSTLTFTKAYSNDGGLFFTTTGTFTQTTAQLNGLIGASPGKSPLSVKSFLGTSTQPTQSLRSGLIDPIPARDSVSCSSGNPGYGSNGYRAPLDESGTGVYARAYLCGTTNQIFQYKSTTASWVQQFSYAVSSGLSAFDLTMTPTKTFFATHNDISGGGRLEVASQITPQAPATFTPQATQAVTSLVGFDVDQTGSAVVTRENNGDVVNAYSGNDLNLVGTVATPDCSVGSLFDGVAIEYGTIITPTLTINEPFIIYETCRANGRTERLYITNANLGPPAFNPLCDTQSGSCQNPIEDKGGCVFIPTCQENPYNSVDVPDIAQISELNEAPWDWSNYHVHNSAECSQNGFVIDRDCINYSLLSLAFTDTLNDHVGIFSVVQNGNGNADSRPTIGKVTIANVQDPAQICTTTFNGVDYMGAIGTGDAYRSWQIRVSAIAASGGLNNAWYEPSNSFTLTNSVSTGNFNDPIGVACQRNVVGVLNSNGIVSFLALNGPNQGNVFQTATIGIHGRGLILSNPTCPSCPIATGNYFYAYINFAETEIKVVNMTSNQVVATLAVPQGVGSYVGMKFDRNAQHLFLAQADQLSVWDIHASTTIRTLSAGQALSPTNQTVTVGISDGEPDSDGDGISDMEEQACITNGACVGLPGSNATQAAGQSFAASLFNGYFSPLVASYVATAILIIVLELFVLFVSFRFSNGGSPVLYSAFFMLGLSIGVPLFGLPWIVLIIILLPVVALIIMRLSGRGAGE